MRLLPFLLLVACPRRPVSGPEDAPAPVSAAPGWSLQPMPLGGGASAPIWDAANAPDGRLLLAVRGVGGALVDGKGGQPTTFAAVPDLQRVAANPDHPLVVLAAWETIAAIDPLTANVRWELHYEANPHALAWFPSQDALLSVVERTVRRHDGATGAVAWSWTAPAPTDPSIADSVGSATTDGATVYTHAHDRVVALDAATGAELRDVVRAGDRVSVLALSPAADRLLIGSWDRSFRILDPRTDFEVAAIPTAAWALSGAWRKDGTEVALLDLDGALQIRTQDGAAVASLQLPSPSTTAGLLYRPDGTLVVWSDDGAWTVQRP